jgi:hypothetical protein
MADDIRRDERDQSLPSTREGGSPSENSPLEGSPRESSPFEGSPGVTGSPSESWPRESSPERGSPLGTDPQEASPLPGDPRDAQQPQEPRSTHIGAPGREGTSHHEEAARPVEASPREENEDKGVVEQIKDAWDKMRGKH